MTSWTSSSFFFVKVTFDNSLAATLFLSSSFRAFNSFISGVVVVEDVTYTVLVDDANAVVFVEPVTDTVEILEATETVGKRSGCDIGAVGAVGLALAAWWQAARFLFFSISADPR